MNVLGKPVVGLRWRLEWKPEDLWVGVFWKQDNSRDSLLVAFPFAFDRYDLWLCLLPCLPIHVTWYRERPR